MIAVIAPVGRQIESDRKTLLPGGKVAPVEGIRRFGSRETGILAHGPRALDIHGRVGAAHIGGQARQAWDMIQARSIAPLVAAFDVDALWRMPRLAC
jgi:hypothetical protein